MGPRLAPLALLLLALCGFAAGKLHFTVQSMTSKSTQSSIVMSKAKDENKNKMAEKMNKEMAPINGLTDTTKAEKLLNLLGNSILFSTFGFAGLLEEGKMHLNIQKALAHGVLCEFTDTLNADIVALTGDTNAKDKQDINCATEPTSPDPAAQKIATIIHDCVCKQNKVGMYCMALSIKQSIESDTKHPMTKGTCRKDALTALENAGTRELGKQYDIEGFINGKFDDEFNGKVSDKDDVATANLYCDATKEDVYNAVKALYASDSLYWITETVTFAILFADVDNNVEDGCKDSDFKKSTLGECICKVETGFTFCILKALGTFYEKEGYLKCDGATKAFVPTSKPKALPVTVLAKPKKTSSATTAFSLFVPAFAAATLLLRH